MTTIHLDEETLRPLVQQVVQQTLSLCDDMTGGEGMRLAWREDEAAKLVGMQPHQLRDRRLEGEVRAKKVGRSWYYTRDELLRLFDDKRR